MRGLPDDGGNFGEADVFAVRPDGRAEGIIDTCYRRTIAAGLLCGELPCPAFVEGICSNAGCARGILIITTDNDDDDFVGATYGKNSRGGLAVGNGCCRDDPVPRAAGGANTASARAAG